MNDVVQLKEQVLSGQPVTGKQALQLLDVDLRSLCEAADTIRKRRCAHYFDLCSIINGKSGRCSEDCKYCAQSVHYPVETESYPLLDAQEVVERACSDYARGVRRFSVVTSGRALSQEETQAVCHIYEEIGKHCEVSCCASHGLLRKEQLVCLQQAGVKRYHCNLETSRRYFPFICTTHSYDEKIETLQIAAQAGLELCSGGIIGLGETMEDRIDMALDLRSLGVHSVPINILNPIPGTPFEKLPSLSPEEVLRTVAIFRFLLPDAALRLAGGRGLLHDKGRSAFQSGANAAITGDMLTTSGITIERDLQMLTELGYKVGML